MDESKGNKRNIAKLALIAACITGTYAIIITIMTINSHIEKNKLEQEYKILQEVNSSLQTQLNNLSDAYDNVLDSLEENALENEVLNNHAHDIYIQIFSLAAKIRSAPDSSSDMIGSALQGEQFLLLGTVSDARGYEWYQVSFGDGTGYIRSDLVTIVE